MQNIMQFPDIEKCASSQPARYFISQTPRMGSSAIYAPALCVTKQGTQTRACILRQFCPEKLRKHAQPSPYTGAFSLRPSSGFFISEWNDLKKQFEHEPGLNREILAHQEGFPAVFPISPVNGRDDLHVIYSGDAIPLANFAAARRQQALTSDYLSLCLSIVSRLLHSVSTVHKVCLHLNITPHTVYIDSGGCTPERLNASSPFSVTLLDLTAARRKEELLLPRAGLSLYISGTYTYGFSDTRLCDILTLSSRFSEIDDYLKRYPIDERSDLFSIAAVAYFLLTGQSPRTDGETFHALLPAEGPLRSSMFRRRLEDLLSKALRLSGGYARAESALSEFSEELYTIQQQL